MFTTKKVVAQHNLKKNILKSKHSTWMWLHGLKDMECVRI